MPLSPEQEWTLVACGLIAHADGILDVGEWDQVLWMLDERIAAADAEAWTVELADRERLLARLDGLPLPPPFFSETILERSWRMALADGRGSEQEAAVHDDIARRLGVDAAEVARLREGWAAKARKRAEVVARFAAMLANLDGRVDVGERAEYDALLDRLPLADDRRSAAQAWIDDPPDLDDVVGGLAAMDPEERGIALISLAPVVHATARGGRERTAFLDLAERVAVPRPDAERLLDR
jgi:tellurite resistance protein